MGFMSGELISGKKLEIPMRIIAEPLTRMRSSATTIETVSAGIAETLANPSPFQLESNAARDSALESIHTISLLSQNTISRALTAQSITANSENVTISTDPRIARYEEYFCLHFPDSLAAYLLNKKIERVYRFRLGNTGVTSIDIQIQNFVQ